MSGVKLPPLGSTQDVVLRKHLTQETTKRVKANRLIANLALISASASKSSGELVRTLVSEWNEYVNIEYGMEEEVIRREESLQKEYEKIRHLRPKAKMTENGLVVDGIPV